MLNRVRTPVLAPIAVDDDIVTFAGGRPEPIDAIRGQQPLVDDAPKQRLGVLVEIARRGSVLRMVENRREATLQLPGGEEERPVDVRHDGLERHASRGLDDR